MIALGFRSGSLDILTSTSLQEGSHIKRGEFLCCDENLKTDHQHECNFVLFEETSVNVTVNVLCHHLDDEVYSLLR